jgi:hypothetical protein
VERTNTGLGRTHLLLAIQSVVIVLLSINRLSSLTTGYVAANEFLRWVDLINMIPLPLTSLIAFYLLKKHMESGVEPVSRMGHLAVNLAFITGVYLLGASYGDHEVTNYLHVRFCSGEEAGSALCQIIIFNDDEFSHWVFFTGFVLVNAAMLMLQVLFPHPSRLPGRDLVLLAFNGLFIGMGIFANLAFETIGLDLYVVALLALLGLYLLWRKGAQPLIVYYNAAYWIGLAATGLYQLV